MAASESSIPAPYRRLLVVTRIALLDVRHDKMAALVLRACKREDYDIVCGALDRITSARLEREELEREREALA